MPAPTNGRPRAANKRPDSRRAASIALILGSLPGTKTQLVERTGICRDVVYSAVNQLHSEPGRQIRICKWLPHPLGGPSMAVYEVGTEPDAKDTLRRLTKAQISARYYANLKKTDRYDQMKAKWRSKHWEKKAAKAPNTWLNILGGAA
ncbi:hypothetical protein [Massilia pseudoviolaceinigra]|uniref:hypothetical protein n=1 Tax=Massilia pseudoviolaceinigra TaxID=3057165 RepID=UPI002796B55F|nr:hypothetical protein [Massilia sp. CCM 9206]MDQ1921655.1 hypothetical protein [Massilia sp. CCM 9206]